MPDVVDDDIMGVESVEFLSLRVDEEELRVRPWCHQTELLYGIIAHFMTCL